MFNDERKNELVKLEDFYGAIEDIIEGQGATDYSINERQYKSFTGGIIAPFMLSTLGEKAKNYFAISDAGVTANAEFCVGLTSNGNGSVDGVFRFLFSEMLITVDKSERIFETTKGEHLLNRLIDSTRFSVKHVAKINGAMCDIVMPKIISTKFRQKFTEFKRIGRGTRYAPISINTDWLLPDNEEFASDVWDKVKEAFAVSDYANGTVFGCDPVAARVSTDGLQRELVFHGTSLSFSQACLKILKTLGLSRIYIKTDKGVVTTVLHFEED